MKEGTVTSAPPLIVLTLRSYYYRLAKTSKSFEPELFRRKRKTPPKLLGFLPRLLFAAGRNVEVLLPLEYLRLSGANRTFE